MDGVTNHGNGDERMNYKKEKRPTIDEELQNVVLSRFFGQNYTKSQKSERVFLGYMDGIVCEVYFYTNMFVIEQVKKEYSAIKFGNKAMNTLFATRGLRCTTAERINFDNTTCISVLYDKVSVIFHFWYRVKDDKAV